MGVPVKLDAVALAKTAVGPLREALAPILKQGTQDARDLARKLSDLEDDVAITVRTLQAETNPVKAALLREDLERFLPSRRAAILSQIASAGASDVEAAATVALDVGIKVAVSVARAMVGV